jgi:hypothetical protein
MNYRLVPVGDKLVVMVVPDATAGSEEYVYVRDPKASCYDFDTAGANENEGLNEVSTWIGGTTHE